MEKFRTVLGKIPTGVPTCIVVAAILWLTLVPRPVGDLELPLFPGADKIAHGLMFMGLALIVLLENIKRKGWQELSMVRIGTICFICAGFGIGTELLQRAMHLGRTFETLDMLADAAGAMGAGGIWLIVQDIIAIK